MYSTTEEELREQLTKYLSHCCEAAALPLTLTKIQYQIKKIFLQYCLNCSIIRYESLVRRAKGRLKCWLLVRKAVVAAHSLTYPLPELWLQVVIFLIFVQYNMGKYFPVIEVCVQIEMFNMYRYWNPRLQT